jgi:TonB family protein
MSKHIALACIVTALFGCKKPVPVVVTPKAIENPGPSAERIAETAAAKEKRSGATHVGYCVDAAGTTANVKVLEPFEPEFDALAVETVKGWTFEPATRDGVSYQHCTDVRIELR